MKFLKFSLIVAALFAALPSFAEKATWVSDPVGTFLQISFLHSNLFEVTNIAPNVIATATFDGEDITKAHFEVSAAIVSLWSHNNLFDGAMKSKEFFNAQEHPVITFQSTKITADGKGFRVRGDLTANGVIRPTEFHMTASKIVPWDGVQFRAFTLTAQIDRKDFGMTFVDPDGLKDDPLFDKMLTLKINIEVTDKPNASGYNAPQTRFQW